MNSINLSDLSKIYNVSGKSEILLADKSDNVFEIQGSIYPAELTRLFARQKIGTFKSGITLLSSSNSIRFAYYEKDLTEFSIPNITEINGIEVVHYPYNKDNGLTVNFNDNKVSRICRINGNATIQPTAFIAYSGVINAIDFTGNKNIKELTFNANTLNCEVLDLSMLLQLTSITIKGNNRVKYLITPNNKVYVNVQTLTLTF